MKYKYTILGVLSLVVLASFVSFSFPTGMFFGYASTVHTQNVQDIVYKFLGVAQSEFLQANNVQCQNIVKEVFNNALKLEPDQKESAIVPGAESGFATVVFTKKYSSGTVSMVKGKEFLADAEGDIPAKLSFEIEKIVFMDYSDVKKSIQTNFELEGVVEGGVFVVRKGSLASNGVNCKFND